MQNRETWSMIAASRWLICTLAAKAATTGEFWTLGVFIYTLPPFALVRNVPLSK